MRELECSTEYHHSTMMPGLTRASKVSRRGIAEDVERETGSLSDCSRLKSGVVHWILVIEAVRDRPHRNGRHCATVCRLVHPGTLHVYRRSVIEMCVEILREVRSRRPDHSLTSGDWLDQHGRAAPFPSRRTHQLLKCIRRWETQRAGAERIRVGTPSLIEVHAIRYDQSSEWSVLLSRARHTNEEQQIWLPLLDCSTRFDRSSNIASPDLREGHTPSNARAMETAKREAGPPVASGDFRLAEKASDAVMFEV
jgi:hypothetical protein